MTMMSERSEKDGVEMAGLGAEFLDEGEDVAGVASEEGVQMGGGFGASILLEGDTLRRAHWLLTRLIHSS
jgi:hypothetical protein